LSCRSTYNCIYRAVRRTTLFLKFVLAQPWKTTKSHYTNHCLNQNSKKKWPVQTPENTRQFFHGTPQPSPTKNGKIALETPRTPLFRHSEIEVPCFCWTKPLKIQQKRSSCFKCNLSIFGRLARRHRTICRGVR